MFCKDSSLIMKLKSMWRDFSSKIDCIFFILNLKVQKKKKKMEDSIIWKDEKSDKNGIS